MLDNRHLVPQEVKQEKKQEKHMISTMPGFPELLAMIVILIIIFGARQLPQMGARIDRWIAQRKQASAPDTQASTPDTRQD